MQVVNDEINRLTSGHRFLVELNLMGYEFTGDGAIYIIRHLDLLKKIFILLKNRVEYDRLLNQKSDEWKTEYIGSLYDNIVYTGSMYISLKR